MLARLKEAKNALKEAYTKAKIQEKQSKVSGTFDIFVTSKEGKQVLVHSKFKGAGYLDRYNLSPLVSKVEQLKW